MVAARQDDSAANDLCARSTYGTAVATGGAGTAASTFEGGLFIFGINNAVQRQAALYAISIAGVITNPLDVVKTRL